MADKEDAETKYVKINGRRNFIFWYVGKYA